MILVGEMRDKETIEIALEAAETGHLVFSTLHTTDASKTVERIIGVFPLSDQNAIRNRLAKVFRFIVSQRLIPTTRWTGRVAAFEILKSTMRTREYVERGESEGKSLLDAMRDGDTRRHAAFRRRNREIDPLRMIDIETGLSYATNYGNLKLRLDDLGGNSSYRFAPARVGRIATALSAQASPAHRHHSLLRAIEKPMPLGR